MPAFFNSKILTASLSVLCVWLLLLAIGSRLRHGAAERELSTLQGRISASHKENDRLAVELDRIKQPSWLALLARTRLNYKLPDETVVFVYKSEKPGTISQPHEEQVDDRSNLQKWVDWIRGK